MATSTTAGTPTSTPSTPPSTGDVAPTQLSHLKDLVSQLQAKIERLEAQAGKSVGAAVESVKEAITPAQHLRIVLMGPPGAGKYIFFLTISFLAYFTLVFLFSCLGVCSVSGDVALCKQIGIE